MGRQLGGRAAALVVLAIALLTLLVWQIRKHHTETDHETTPTT